MHNWFNFIFVYIFFSWCLHFRFDFDNQAISPPAHDESFFYIRYPTGASINDKKSSTTSSSIKSTISDAINKQNIDAKTNLNKGNLIEKKNMVQHTEPCKKFLNSKERGMYLIFFLFFLFFFCISFCIRP